MAIYLPPLSVYSKVQQNVLKSRSIQILLWKKGLSRTTEPRMIGESQGGEGNSYIGSARCL